MKIFLHLKRSLFILLLLSLGTSLFALNYNQNDSLKLRNFLSQGKNAASLGFSNLDPLLSCPGLTWSSDTSHPLRILSIVWNANSLSGSLDLSGCDSLQSLVCSDNSLTSLALSGCNSLQSLDCYWNILTSLALSGCTSLQTLNCSVNYLTSLSLSGYTSLQTLDYSNNSLTSLDLSGCTSLQTLNCKNNRLTSLALSGCTSLQTLNCSNNRLTSLALGGCNSLQSINCKKNNLLYSALAPLIADSLQLLYYAPQNQVLLAEVVNLVAGNLVLDLSKTQSIDLSREVAPIKDTTLFSWTRTRLGQTFPITLQERSPGVFMLDKSLLKAGDQLQLKMTNADFPDFTYNSDTLKIVPMTIILTYPRMNAHDSLQLRHFISQGNNAQNLGLRDLDSLVSCSGLGWEVDTSDQLLISSIEWHDKSLSGSLDLSGCNSLRSLDCSDNSLTSLDLKGCNSLQTLHCYRNSLTSLDLSGDTSLQHLNCPYNNLTSLALSGCNSLQFLMCRYNNFLYSALAPLIADSIPTLYYAPQNQVLLAEAINLGAGNLVLDLSQTQSIDLSREVVPIKDTTLFSWTRTRQGQSSSITLLQNTPGVFLLDKSKFQAGDKLQLKMTNADFPDFNNIEDTLQTMPMTILLVHPRINAHDSLQLRHFLSQGSNGANLVVRDLDSLQNCQGLNWKLDTGYQLRISALNWQNKALRGNLDLSACDSLSSLNCSNNFLTGIELAQCNALSFITCDHNNLVFSSLVPILTQFPASIYAPQNRVILNEEIQNGQGNYFLNLDQVTSIDLSSEVHPLSAITTFTWTRMRSGITSSISPEEITQGVFKMDTAKLHNGDLLQLTMSNSDFASFDSYGGLQTDFIPISYTQKQDSIPSTPNEDANLSPYPLRIYPNPAQSHFSIVSSGDYRWAIYNSLGTAVQEGTANGNATIHLNLQKGLYFVRIYKKDRAPQVRKLMVI